MGVAMATPSWALRITEICPRPDALDPNNKEAGWIELTNTSEAEVNLSEYALIRFNRGKEDKKKNRKTLPEITLGVGERILVYTSEEYPNADAEDENVALYDKGETGEQMIVFPFKVNPKKYPTVRLYKGSEIVGTFIVPVDLEDNKSFGPLEVTTLQTSVIDETTSYDYRVATAEEATWSTGSGRLVGCLKERLASSPAPLEMEVSADDSTVIMTTETDDKGVSFTSAWDLTSNSGKNTGLTAPASVTEALVESGMYTLSLWFRTTAEGNSYVPLFDSRPSTTGDASGLIVVMDAENQIMVQARDAQKMTQSVSSNDDTCDFNDGAWHHILVVAGQSVGDPLILWVDGIERANTTLSVAPALHADKALCFGRALDSSHWNAFNGMLAGIQLFAGALSEEELLAVYEESSSFREVTGALTASGSTLTQAETTGIYTFAEGTTDATGAYLEASIDDTLVAGGETVDLWVKPQTLKLNRSKPIALVDARNGSAEGYMLILGEEGQIRFQRGVGGTESFEEITLTTKLSAEEWTHLTLMIETVTNQGSLYVNGVYAETFTMGPTYVAASCSHRFGGSRDTYWSSYVGELVAPKVYSGLLAEREIARIHNDVAEVLGEPLVLFAPSAVAGTTQVVFESAVAYLEGKITIPASAFKTNEYLQLAFDAVGGALSFEWNGVSVAHDAKLKPQDSTSDNLLEWTLSPSPETTEHFSVTPAATIQREVSGVLRAIFSTLTPGEENDVASAVPYGPNVGPAVGSKEEHNGVTALSPAPVGEDYVVTYEIHPLSSEEMNQITTVRMRYQANFDEIKTVEMVEILNEDGTTTYKWQGVIPSADLPGAGHLIRHAALITDANGSSWASPSRNNLDDCPLWFGTIMAPTADQLGSTDLLQTFHLFADAESLKNMDKQYDDISGSHPYGARVAIYDSQTDTFYDNVRIDLRGNTSASFNKKSHGLRFNKCQPLTCVNPFSGEKIDELRKVSFISEYFDAAFVRQALSFWVWREAGNLVPYDYPVRLQMNGEFYQLAFHSNRFTDELIEDYYDLDPMGYGYKNVGLFNPGLSTTAGGIEKKTPDDGVETGDAAMAPLKAFANCLADVKAITESSYEEIPTITQEVVKSFDLPAWINYLATARITQEADDVWANICAYYDVNGTDTWMPLAYDHNLSFGQWYYNDDTSNGRCGLRADDDTYKSHPFYGGHRVRAHRGKSFDGSVIGADGNYAVEAVWQSPKYRRLYLRRLRTLMDEILKAPDTSKEETPFWQYAESLWGAFREECELDRTKWEYAKNALSSTSKIYVWEEALTLEEGIEDLWSNYVEKRRTHLFVTHSINNTEKEVGYGKLLNAGIPNAQSALADLKANLSFGNAVDTDGSVSGFIDGEKLVILNHNDEAIDMSGWRLSGAVKWTLPAGTVIDQQITTGEGGEQVVTPGALIIVFDRKTYVNAMTIITDEVIVGNAEYSETERFVTLTAADEEETVMASVSWAPQSVAQCGLRVAEVMPAPAGDNDENEYIVLKNILTDEVINLKGVNVRTTKDGDGETPSVNVILPEVELQPGATYRLDQADYKSDEKGWNKITNGDVNLEIYDANGVLCQYAHWVDDWHPEADGGGASLIAVYFDATIDEASDWRPSFTYPENDAKGTIVKEAIATTPAIGNWLGGLDAEGKTAFASFTGSATDLTTCYLVDIDPIAEPEVALEVTSISFNADGTITVTTNLEISGAVKEGSINGLPVLIGYESLSDTTGEEIGMDENKRVPFSLVPPADGEKKYRFFRVRIR